MIKLIMNQPELSDDVELEAVSWLVAKTTAFTPDDIIHRALNDSTNLETKQVNYILDENEVVYAKVKLHFNDGEASEWSKPVAIDESTKGFSYSGTIIGTPRVNVNANINELPLGGFEISASAFKLYSGAATHESTTYKLRNSNGQVVWERPKDKNNLYNITVPEDILTQGTAIDILVIYHGQGADKSLPGTKHTVTVGRGGSGGGGSGTGVPTNDSSTEAYLVTPPNGTQGQYKHIATSPKELNNIDIVIGDNEQAVLAELTINDDSSLEINDGGVLMFVGNGDE